MYKLNLSFAKNGQMVYISHLDLMRLFSRALRRAMLPIKMTEGFNPHPKFSIKRALKLGVASENEEVTFSLRESMNLEEFRRRLQQQLPEGIVIKSIRPEMII